MVLVTEQSDAESEIGVRVALKQKMPNNNYETIAVGATEDGNNASMMFASYDQNGAINESAAIRCTREQ